MHPIMSIKARYRKYISDHFENSKYGKKLRKFKNIHLGDTCVIIGNGPSLTADDLEILYKNKIKTFAFNRIYLMFEKTNWRPNYYISQDEKTLKPCQNKINEMQLKYKFIPLFHKYYHDINIKNAYYFMLKSRVGEEYIFSKDISSFVGNSETVAYTAAQIAVYMGFKKIYLIGVDHSFSVTKNDKGEIIRNPDIKDYFVDEYNKDKENLYIPNLDRSTRVFMAMKSYCDANAVQVFNATRGGKLEVFERVDFDRVFVNTNE